MLDPCAMILTEVPHPTLCLLIHSGAEDARLGEAVSLHDGRRVDNHEVDGRTRGGVATYTVMRTRLCKGDSSIEPALGDGDDAHIVVHLDIVVDSVFTVHGVTGNTRLEITVHGRVDEQDTSLIRNFRIVQFLSAKVDSIDRARTSADVLSGFHAVGGVLGVVTEADCVRLRDRLGAKIL